jgi:hypothetical protein
MENRRWLAPTPNDPCRSMFDDLLDDCDKAPVPPKINIYTDLSPSTRRAYIIQSPAGETTHGL